MLLRSAVKPVNVRSTIEWVCKSPLVADGGRPMRLAIIGLSPNAGTTPGIPLTPECFHYLYVYHNNSNVVFHPERPSYEVASGMQSFGYAIVPVNPVAAGKTILGVPCVASLEEVEGAACDIKVT